MNQIKKVYLSAALVIASCCGVLFQNCAEAPPPAAGSAQSSSVYVAPIIPPNAINSVACTFNGQSVPNGQYVFAYQSASVAAGSTCLQEQRNCNNGVLSGSYTFSTCAPASATGTASCAFDGTTVANNTTVTAYSSTSVPYGSTCVSQPRTCSNGTLSGSYLYLTCSPLPAPPPPTGGASCTLDGLTLLDTQGAVFYTKTTALTQTGCNYASQYRTCNNGVLSGSSTYMYSGCTPTGSTTGGCTGVLSTALTSTCL